MKAFAYSGKTAAVLFLLISLVASPFQAHAILPDQWHYFSAPDPFVYSFMEGFWYSPAPGTGSHPVYNTVSGQWIEFGSMVPPHGWIYFSWPYGFVLSEQVWYYFGAVALPCISLETLVWSWYGADPTWTASVRDGVLEITYGTPGLDRPQFAALHLNSGYLRLIYDRNIPWGTSVVVMPAFWSGGTYHQGNPVNATWAIQGDDLVISLSGTLAGLSTQGQVVLSPPVYRTLSATVSMQTTGTVALDNRPGEAFKPVMLSSMHVSAYYLDSTSAYADSASYNIPAAGWIVQPHATASRFGLIGPAVGWQAGAPTVDVQLTQPFAVTGWVTPSSDQNDDNVGYWAATDTVLNAWSYTLTAMPPPAP